MPRFPTRTLVLMVLTLVAFAWMWRQIHRATPPVNAAPVQLVGVQGAR